MEGIDRLDEYIKKISSSMRFSSNEIGEFFKIRILQPCCGTGMREKAFHCWVCGWVEPIK